jgi:hypothetical protein
VSRHNIQWLAFPNRDSSPSRFENVIFLLNLITSDRKEGAL